MITLVETFGGHVKRERLALGLLQKQLAAHIRTEEGHPIQQAQMSKIEGSVYPPSPDTVLRVATALAALAHTTPDEMARRLLRDVPSKYDVATAHEPVDLGLNQETIQKLDALPARERDALYRSLRETVERFVSRRADFHNTHKK
jgi:transcriptional regulator with XRE-family HTH domain